MCDSRWHPSLIGLVVGYVVIMVLFPCEAIATDWKDRLLSEAPPKWAVLEQYYTQMEATFRSIVTEVPKTMERPKHITYFDIRKNGGLIVSTRRSVGERPDGKRMDEYIVKGINSRYAFKLGKPTPDAETFILFDFQRANDEKRQDQEDSSFSLVFKTCISNCVPLSTLIKHPDVTITGRDAIRLPAFHSRSAVVASF